MKTIASFNDKDMNFIQGSLPSTAMIPHLNHISPSTYEKLTQLPGLQLCFSTVTMIVPHLVAKGLNYKWKVILEDKGTH